MKNLLKIAGAAAVVLASSQAYAQDAGNVIFGGDILNTCTISDISAGSLEAGSNNTVLSSKTAGGAAGGATITANSDIFNVSVTPPSAFSDDPGGVPATTFEADFNFVAGGATPVLAAASEGPEDLTNGTTNVEVDLVASTTNVGDTFPTGAYEAIVVLTCE